MVRSKVCESGRPDLFVLHVEVIGERCTQFREYLYEKESPSAHNEGLLLQNIDPSLLGIPDVVSEYETALLKGRLFRLPDEATIPNDENWSDVCASALAASWAVEPTKSLEEIFSRSKLLLHERLTEESLGILRISLETTAEINAFEGLLTMLPAITQRLEQLPTFVFHGPYAREHMLVADRKPIVLDWRDWSIEPVGVGLHMIVDSLKESVKRAQGNSSGARSAQVSESDLMLASLCWELERAISARRFRYAHTIVAELVESQTLAGLCQARVPAVRYSTQDVCPD
jgi:hypothetical protein